MSFSLLKTNVGLTTNLKIMIGSNYELSLDSIDSSEKLSESRFKNFKFNKNNPYDEILPLFYKGVPSESSFEIKNRDDKDIMIDNFDNQYETLYSSGARNILNNKDYSEEYEYFAPLYLGKELPSNFIIFRVDGSGLLSLNKDNIISEVINKLKVVKVFDFSEDKPLGEWINRSFISNEYFPIAPLEIDYRELEFSRWNGIDYKTGGFTSKSLFLNNIIRDEKEIFELDKFTFDFYKNNDLVFPNILNLSFLFNDTPGTPLVPRKWSLNRYYGFYTNIEKHTTLSPYRTPSLKPGFTIEEDNIIFNVNDINDPFVKWSDDYPFFIEYEGEFFQIERYSIDQGDAILPIDDIGFTSEDYQTVIKYVYKIIADIDLSGKQSDINKNYGFIENNTLKSDGVFEINDFDDCDVWLIKIDGIYHNLVKDNGSIKINTDYDFSFSVDHYEYKVNSVSTRVSTVVDFNNDPQVFEIYKVSFLDIKDFDTKIVDTEYSKFEYEKTDELTLTDEPKMYMTNLASDTNPKNIDDFILNNKVVNIPVSSEYTANHETFKINKGLSDIWNLNPIYCRWVYKNSISNNDVPYVFNNSSVFEEFNRSTNVLINSPTRSERNLDYFYSYLENFDEYEHHSLHIDEKFIISDYITNVDYFSDKLEKRFEFSDSKRNIKKYSKLNKGDVSSTNTTLFRGIEFRIYEIDSIILTNNQVEKVNIRNTNKFDDYKFSIVLTEKESSLEWTIIDEWKMETPYIKEDIVIFDDILYKAKTNNTINEPTITHTSQDVLRSAPYNSTDWEYRKGTIFWSPEDTYSKYDFIYNNKDYYYCVDDASLIDFWNPTISDDNNGYTKDDIVLFKGKYHKSMVDDNRYSPNYDLDKTLYREFQKYNRDGTRELPKYWDVVDEPIDTKWKLIELWNPTKSYILGTGDSILVYHNGIIYKTSVSIEIGREPGIEILWSKMYNITPDTDYLYTMSNNPIIEMNNRYYLSNNIRSVETLDNGIVVHINKKYKNILINIKINDNSLEIGGERDTFYNDLYSNLTAFNFISGLNEFNNRHGFSDYVKYVIIDDDIKEYSYDNNIEGLPYIISGYFPDKLDIRFSALSKTYDRTVINPRLYLEDGKVDDISKLNWYNKIPLAYYIDENEFTDIKVRNYNGLVNKKDSIYRFSGYYEPLFNDIQLFKKGNYKFDTMLTDFGLIKEVKIRKVNRNGSILKKGESIYPMVDEFGYTFINTSIFLSNWDFNYSIETIESNREVDKEDSISIPTDIGQSRVTKLENLKKYNL